VPALLKSISIRPKLTIVSFTASSTSLRLVTSHPSPRASVPYSFCIASATFLALSACASVTTILAPSRANVRTTACPIPTPAAAVKKATLFFNFMQNTPVFIHDLRSFLFLFLSSRHNPTTHNQCQPLQFGEAHRGGTILFRLPGFYRDLFLS